jgi:hypothetical protein
MLVLSGFAHFFRLSGLVRYGTGKNRPLVDVLTESEPRINVKVKNKTTYPTLLHVFRSPNEDSDLLHLPI